jgi:tetratricopeptide (TPR) repeat protein
MSGLLGGRKNEPDPNRCFVMMPFAESFNAIYRLIQRVCVEQGLACTRADEDVKPGKITGKIYEAVSDAGIIIADMTGKNPNVFYEMGLAHAISDNVILLTQTTDDVPFDLKDFLHIQYANTFDGAERLASDLSKVITTILRSADSQAARRRLEELPNNAPQASPIQSSGTAAETEFSDNGDDLGLFHLRAELARNAGDLGAARQFLSRALELSRTVDGEANEIGNCAIEAEKCKFYDLAESLYEIAVDHDPMHVNNRQCYVSFILDHRSKKPGSMERAQELLVQLEKLPERQERTRALRAQYLTIGPTALDDAGALDQIVKDMLAGRQPQSIDDAAPILLVLQRAKQYEKFAELIEQIKQTTAGDLKWRLDRALADCYADSDAREMEEKAIEIYETLLSSGADDSPAIKHNLATLIYSKDRTDKSGRAKQLWTDAYRQSPGNMNIRRALARYFARLNMNAEANLALEGKPLA